MTIVLTGDKKVLSLLSPEDAKLVLLALFAEDGDLPEMTPLANMAYTSICKIGIMPNTMKSTKKAGSDSAGVHVGEENSTGLHEQRFNEFWAAYPRKIGKEAARKAWQRIKPTADHLVKILSAVENAKKSSQWLKDNGQYIPNPATWLNQGRWDDEIQPYSVGWQHKCNRNIRNIGNYSQREYDSHFFDQFVTTDFGETK